jgi:hypothetical protein
MDRDDAIRDAYAAGVLFTILAIFLWMQPITAIMILVMIVVMYLQMPPDDAGAISRAQSA